jgi:hypothetical protein
MLKTFKFAVGAALIAASQLAIAEMAEVKISNFKFEVFNGQWWAELPTWNSWEPQPSGTLAELYTPSFNDVVSGRRDENLTSSVTDGKSQAQASLLALGTDKLNGASAAAWVNVTNGQSGSAYVNVYGGPPDSGGGRVQVGGNATVRVSFTVDSFIAIGDQSQANASIEFCNWDTKVCENANFEEAFIDGSSPPRSGPFTMTASWTNPGDSGYVGMHIGLSAFANSVAAPVPEPSTTALWLAGLLGAGALARRRRQR